MITIWQGIILGLLQGVSELFPISSLGHSVIFPSIFGWHLNQSSPTFLLFLIATHLATATILFLFFWKDWMRILSGMLVSLRDREIAKTNLDGKLGWLLVVGTLPAGLLGFFFESTFQKFFASPKTAALFLIANGIMLFGAEMLRRKKKSALSDSDSRIAQTSWLQAIGVGTAQAIALFPGFSRTGATLSSGLLLGLTHEDAVRYSFLLATPIIAGAAVAKLPDLAYQQQFVPVVLGGVVAAGAAAYFSVKFLTKYFKTNNLFPFAIYCGIAGIVALLLIR